VTAGERWINLALVYSVYSGVSMRELFFCPH
jgi:hypothetical protein